MNHEKIIKGECILVDCPNKAPEWYFCNLHDRKLTLKEKMEIIEEYYIRIYWGLKRRLKIKTELRKFKKNSLKRGGI